MSKETGHKDTHSGRKKIPVEIEQAGGALEPDLPAGPGAKDDPELIVEERLDAGMREAKVEELERENSEILDALVRLKAEFENYRKRMLKEQTRILETAEGDLIKKLLPVIDNLERAIDNSAGGGGTDGVAKGVAMVLGQLLDILSKEGLEVIDPEGEPFDPEHHEAMMVVETDECPEDTVTEVTQKGYRFNGLLVRPAMVKVSCPVKT